jgi:hypothetical protein
MNKKIKITIQRLENLGIGAPYKISKLVNAVRVTSGVRGHDSQSDHAVGDGLREEQIEGLLKNRRYEVTVTL